VLVVPLNVPWLAGFSGCAALMQAATQETGLIPVDQRRPMCMIGKIRRFK
jgi:hypothetical protein